MSKKLFLLFVLMMFFLSSCAQTTSTQIPSIEITTTEVVATETAVVETPSDNTITLQIYLMDYTPDTIAWLEDTINPAYESEHPGVSVEIVKGSWGDWEKTYDGFFSANIGPDIINIGPEMDTRYSKNLADLGPYLGEVVWPEINNFGPAIKDVMYQGKLSGLPIFTAPRFIFCRLDLMEASGWPSGTPANFAEWVDFARKGSKIDPITNTLIQQALVPFDAGSMADWQWWLLIFNSLGGELYTADGIPNLDSDEALAATQFLLDMRQATYGFAANKVAPLSAGQGSVIDINDETGMDNGAICLAHSGWAAPAFNRAIWEKVSIDAFAGDLPNFPNSKPVILTVNDWLAVPEYSPNKELATDWLKMAFSKDSNNKWAETLGLLPARVDSQFGFVTATYQLQREAELVNQYGVSFAGIKEYGRLSEIMQDVLGKLVSGELSPEQAVDSIQTEYSKVIMNTP